MICFLFQRHNSVNAWEVSMFFSNQWWTLFYNNKQSVKTFKYENWNTGKSPKQASQLKHVNRIALLIQLTQILCCSDCYISNAADHWPEQHKLFVSRQSKSKWNKFKCHYFLTRKSEKMDTSKNIFQRTALLTFSELFFSGQSSTFI